MDDSTIPAVLAEVGRDLDELLGWVAETPNLALATAEMAILTAVRSLGARLLEAGLAARGRGRHASGQPCPCGAKLRCEGYRPKEVQTLLGWITVERAYDRCPGCGSSQVPRAAALGLGRDSHSPGVRRLASRFGALRSFAQAAATLDEAAGVQLSPSTVRTVTEGVGAAREQAPQAAITAAWADG